VEGSEVNQKIVRVDTVEDGAEPLAVSRCGASGEDLRAKPP